MFCIPLPVSLSARHEAFSQDDLVALEIALEGHMDHPLCSDTPCSPKKRQRSKIEQASDWQELCLTSHGYQPGRHSEGGQATAACSLQRERPIARSSWPSILRLNTISSSMCEQSCSCNSSMCSSRASTMTPSCSSPSSQASSMALYSSSTYTESRSPTCSAQSSTTMIDACAVMSESVSSGSWSSRTVMVSRTAAGGALCDGTDLVMPEYGGREVLSEYELGPTLGCGTFGVTRLVTHRDTARPSACKTICKATLASSPIAVSDVQHEVAILQHLSGHSGIVQLQGVFEDERHIHLVMELCTGGDLLDYISRFGRLAEAEAADIARVMLSTLQHCHQLGVVHRDIKPENFLLGAPTILLSPAGSAATALKISDFGVSAFYTPGEEFSEIVGTPFYMAPEVLERSYGPAADIWSVGVVVFLMIAGRLPFNGNTDRQIIKAVLDSSPDFSSGAWKGVSQHAKDFVQQMLVKDPRKRATIHQLLNHPWLASSSTSSRGPVSSCGQGTTAAAAATGNLQSVSTIEPAGGSASQSRSRGSSRAVSCPGQRCTAGATGVSCPEQQSSCSSGSGSAEQPVTPPALPRPLCRLSAKSAARSRFQSSPGGVGW